MKSVLLTSTLAGIAAIASAAALPNPQPQHGPKAVSHHPPKIEQIKSEFSPNNRRVRVTYGTFTMPAFNESSGMGGGGMGGAMGGGMGNMGHGGDMGDMGNVGHGGDMGHMGEAGGMAGMGDMPGGGMMENEGGMLDASNTTALKPCSDCTLKYAKAFLKYPDGTEANINTGAWLHHVTGSVVGPGRVDLRCPEGTQRIPKGMERMLAIHNDRNETFFGASATDAMGFYLGKEDAFNLELVLKNELNQPKDVVFSIEWEFVPGKPKGWADVRGIWLDVAPCSSMMSDIPTPEGKTQFTLAGPAWTSWIDGELLHTVGHMHDGGLEVQILKNNATVCSSKTTYDAKPQYVPSKEAIALGATKMSHISSYSPCLNVGPIKKGDQLSLTASYDLDKWKPGLNKIGEHSDVMGVAMLFVKVNKRYDPAVSSKIECPK